MRGKRLLLVGWDSADWKIMHPMMDAGSLPGISRLVDEGTSGNLTTLEPQLSPMLWTSVATGKMAYHHGVSGFTEVDPRNGAVVPVSAATRRCRTIWEMLGERGLRSNVVGWFATQGEQDLPGHVVSNMFCHVKADDPGNGVSVQILTECRNVEMGGNGVSVQILIECRNGFRRSECCDRWRSSGGR